VFCFFCGRLKRGFETAATPTQNKSGKACLEWHASSQGVFRGGAEKKESPSLRHLKIQKIRPKGRILMFQDEKKIGAIIPSPPPDSAR